MHLDRERLTQSPMAASLQRAGCSIHPRDPMNTTDLQELVQDQAAFRKAFRKPELIELIKGQFKEGRLPFIHQVTLPNGAQLRFKFYNCVKRIYSSKGLELSGKESFLSYLDVSAAPLGIKGYSFIVNQAQIVWGASRSEAEVKHIAQLATLTELATEVGIDLTKPGAWCTIYSEDHK